MSDTKNEPQGWTNWKYKRVLPKCVYASEYVCAWVYLQQTIKKIFSHTGIQTEVSNVSGCIHAWFLCDSYIYDWEFWILFHNILVEGSVKKSCQHNLCDSFLTPKLHSKLKVFLPDELKRQKRRVGMSGWHSGMYLKILSAWGCMVECDSVLNLQKRRYYLFSHYLLSKIPGLDGDLLLRYDFTLYELTSTHSSLH